MASQTEFDQGVRLAAQQVFEARGAVRTFPVMRPIRDRRRPWVGSMPFDRRYTTRQFRDNSRSAATYAQAFQ